MSQAMQNRYAQKEIRTNVLPDIVLTEWDTEIVGVPKKKERVNVVEKMAPQARAARRTAIFTMSLIAVAFALFAGIVWRYAMISEVGKDNTVLESQIEEYDTRLDTLNISILEKSDLRNVQDKAALLNMGFAENSQIRYIKLASDNTHNIEQNKEEDMNFFEKLLQGKLF